MRSSCIYLRSEPGHTFHLLHTITILNLCGKTRKFNINKPIPYHSTTKKWMTITYNYFSALSLVHQIDTCTWFMQCVFWCRHQSVSYEFHLYEKKNALKYQILLLWQSLCTILVITMASVQFPHCIDSSFTAFPFTCISMITVLLNCRAWEIWRPCRTNLSITSDATCSEYGDNSLQHEVYRYNLFNYYLFN